MLPLSVLPWAYHPSLLSKAGQGTGFLVALCGWGVVYLQPGEGTVAPLSHSSLTGKNNSNKAQAGGNRGGEGCV